LGTTVPPRIVSAARSDDGTMDFVVTARLGTKVRLESSSDLLNWALLQEAAANDLRIPFRDADASRFERRFYRLVQASQ
jgi:hypothetical protein